MAEKSPTTMDEVDKVSMDLIYDRFWKTTNRKKNWLNSEEIGPHEYHRWGALNNILEKSPTLAKLMKVGNTDGINHQKVFLNVLDELHLNFKMCELTPDTKHKNQNIICYDVESVPRWTFTGYALNRTDAIAGAAKRGLEFFMLLAQ